MVHPALSKTEIAFRYYNHWTSYNYNRETACKMFCANEKKGAIDKTVLSSIIKEIFNEQKELLKLKK